MDSKGAHAAPEPGRRTLRPPRPRANTPCKRHRPREPQETASPPPCPSSLANTPPRQDGGTPGPSFCRPRCTPLLAPGCAAPAVRRSSEAAPGPTHPDPRRRVCNPRNAEADDSRIGPAPKIWPAPLGKARVTFSNSNITRTTAPTEAFKRIVVHKLENATCGKSNQ